MIALSTAIIFFANAVFSQTGRGLESSFVRSFTGDFAIGATVEESYGLFGNELPIVEEYETIPPLPDYSGASRILERISQITSFAPVVSGAALLNINGFDIKTAVFGVEPSSYFNVCTNVKVEGNALALSAGGVLLSNAIAETASTALNRQLRIGEPITFSSAVSGTFRVRRGFFAGVIRYPNSNPALDRVVLTDPMIVRGLSSYTLGGEAGAVKPGFASEKDINTELDDLFTNASDIVGANETDGMSLEDVNGTISSTTTKPATAENQNSGAWSFILVKTVPGTPLNTLRRKVEKLLLSHSDGYRTIDWKTAAGSSVSALFMLKTAFYIGVAFLVFGAALIVMNALVLSVMERFGEIGTLRALGASCGFIRKLFIIETLLLTVSAAAMGVLIGAAAVTFASNRGIPLSNPMLVSLFGGSLLRPHADIASVVTHLLGAVAVASLAWVYPVFLALRIFPIQAMREDK